MTAQIEELLTSARRARRDGRPEDALAEYRKAAGLARDLASGRLLAHALRHMSDLDREAGRLPQAVSAAREALAACRSDNPDSLELANAIRPLALALDGAGAR